MDILVILIGVFIVGLQVLQLRQSWKIEQRLLEANKRDSTKQSSMRNYRLAGPAPHLERARTVARDTDDIPITGRMGRPLKRVTGGEHGNSYDN